VIGGAAARLHTEARLAPVVYIEAIERPELDERVFKGLIKRLLDRDAITLLARW